MECCFDLDHLLYHLANIAGARDSTISVSNKHTYYIFVILAHGANLHTIFRDIAIMLLVNLKS